VHRAHLRAQEVKLLQRHLAGGLAQQRQHLARVVGHPDGHDWQAAGQVDVVDLQAGRVGWGGGERGAGAFREALQRHSEAGRAASRSIELHGWLTGGKASRRRQ
jgi:hypothetical protein